jgi:nickel/cobalt exporter
MPGLRASGVRASSIRVDRETKAMINTALITRRGRIRLSAIAGVAITLLGLVLPALTSAHPLGNFTINRYNGITVSPAWTQIDRVVDMAELPTVQARQQIDTNRDDDVSNVEGAAWADAICRSATADLRLVIGGREQTLEPLGLGLTFAPGQAGLDTLRLVCTYRADYAPVSAASDIEFRDGSFSARQGWREIVIAGQGVQVVGGEAFATGTSNRLRLYPADAGGAIRAQSTAKFTVVPIAEAGSVALPRVEDAVALGSPADAIVGRSSAVAIVPGGVTDLPSELTRLIGAGDLSIPAILIAVLLAALVGAFHAATPGHGKTLMAAYLVGTSGTVRHALGLGLTVTFAHTVGVFGLGAIVLVAGAGLPSERLFPLLGLVSGLVVTVLGVIFLVQRIRAVRHEHSHEHQHSAEHSQEHDHQGLEHAHGPIRHTHLPETEGPLRRRNLIALGLVGGLVPSASAILILVGSIAAGRPAFGMVLTVAFGAGMAAVLVGVGILLVRARSLVERLPSRNLGRALAFAPVVTALVFVIVGVAITVQAGAQLQ